MHEEIADLYNKLIHDPRLMQMRMFRQHKGVTTYDHSINVMNFSMKIANKLHFDDTHMHNLMIGAMLHDYFLYDYHVTKRHINGEIHAWYHPKAALANAVHDFRLNDIQKNIIRSHMWPLTFLHPPKSREACVVSLADKLCAVLELMLPAYRCIYVIN